jgi:predicted enzyme related to lactoylglutathione lyase
MSMGHRIGWFDIPVTDLDRATEFYRQVLAIEVHRYGEDVPVAVMDHGPGDVSGFLALSEGFEPSQDSDERRGGRLGRLTK